MFRATFWAVFTTVILRGYDTPAQGIKDLSPLEGVLVPPESSGGGFFLCRPGGRWEGERVRFSYFCANYLLINKISSTM